MNLYKKYTEKPHFLFEIDATLASDNPSCFGKNLLERMQKLFMAIDDKINDEKLQFDINRSCKNISIIIR